MIISRGNPEPEVGYLEMQAESGITKHVVGQKTTNHVPLEASQPIGYTPLTGRK